MLNSDIVVLPTPAGPDTKQVLHIGNGVCTPARLHQNFAGWHEVRLDSDPAVNPDIVASPARMQKVATASMDAVYSYRSLQLLHPYEISIAMSEIRRVLKPNGFVLVAVVDLAKVAPYLTSERYEEVIADSGAGPISAADLLFGQRSLISLGKSQLACNCGFVSKTLGTALVKAGFSEVRVQPLGLDLWGHAVKGEVPASSFTILDPPSGSNEASP